MIPLGEEGDSLFIKDFIEGEDKSFLKAKILPGEQSFFEYEVKPTEDQSGMEILNNDGKAILTFPIHFLAKILPDEK